MPNVELEKLGETALRYLLWVICAAIIAFVAFRLFILTEEAPVIGLVGFAVLGAAGLLTWLTSKRKKGRK